MLALFAHSGAIATVFLSWSGLVGLALLRQMFRSAPAGMAGNWLLTGFFAVSLGTAVCALGMFLLGLLGIMVLPVVLGTGTTLAAVACWLLLRARHDSWHVPLDSRTAGEAATACVLLAVVVLGALHPPGHTDDTMYQLPLARNYVRDGALGVDPFLRFPLFPQHMNMLMALGLMVGGTVVAQVLVTLPLFVMALGLMGAARWLTRSIVIGVFAMVMLFTMPAVLATLGYAYVDNGLAMFCWGAALALAIRTQTADSEMGWVVLAGLLAGAAAGTKLFGAVFAALCAVAVLFPRRNLRQLLLFGCAAAMTGAWWYLRSWMISGDPIHPAGGSIFGFYLWDAEDLRQQREEQEFHGVDPATMDIWTALGKAGAGAWVFALLGICLRYVPPAVRVLQLLFAAYLAFWFFVSQVNRYLAPVYAMGFFLVWHTARMLYPLTVVRGAVNARTTRERRVVSCVFVALALAPMVMVRFEAARTSVANWNERLAEVRGYELMMRANALDATYGRRVLGLNVSQARYFYDGTLIGDWFGPGRFRAMQNCDASGCQVVPPETMKSLMARLDARVLVILPDTYTRFDRSAYMAAFDVIMDDHGGLLLALK